LSSPEFADRLKTATRPLHAAAEHSVFMRALLAGRMDTAAYAALLRNLHLIYATLEAGLMRLRSHPAIAPFALPGLERTRPIESDLQAIHGPAWAQELPPPLPATKRYAARLEAIEARRPELLIAHAYVRYLGDLSGGQMLRAVLARSATLNGARALAFYEFGNAATARTLALAFRAALTAAPLDHALEREVIDEACNSFAWHRQIFDDLADAASMRR
jgi:heme oxygenase